MSNLVYESTLYHHGIKGQKWGVRRFQNKDGSYTSKGKLRRSVGNETSEQKPKKKLSTGKKVAIVGATVAGTIIAAYGAKKVYDIVKHKSKGQRYVNKIVNTKKKFEFTPEQKAIMDKNFDDAWNAIVSKANKEWHEKHDHDYDEMDRNIKKIIEDANARLRETHRQRGDWDRISR